MWFLALSTHCYKDNKACKVFTHLRQIREDKYYDDDKHDGILKTVRLFNEYLYKAFVH